MRALLVAVVIGSAALGTPAAAQWYGYGNGYGTVDPRVGTPYPHAVPYGAAPYGAAPYGAAPYGAVPHGYGVNPPAAAAPYWQGHAAPPGTAVAPYGTDGQGRVWSEQPANPGVVTPGARQRCVGQGAARTCW